MLTLPRRVRRKKQPYISLRSRLMTRQIKTQAFILIDEVYEEARRLTAQTLGPAFFRHRSFDTAGEVDIEFGVFTPSLLSPNGPFRADVAPGGYFMSSTWHGACANLGAVHAMFRGWMHEVGQTYHVTRTDEGGLSGYALTIFHQRLDDAPDANNWMVEVAYALPGVDA